MSTDNRTSLRDRYVLVVLPIIVEQRPLPDGGPPDPDYWNRIALSAFACGDAMMRERARRRGSK